MNYGIYIHVPFCRRKCHYCSFYSIPLEEYDQNAALLSAFVVRMIQEMDERLPSFSDDSADTVYFGGGTPSLLLPEQVNSIVQTLRNHLPITPDAEITLEMNPNDVKNNTLKGFLDAGINRIVLGYQTRQEGFHALIGRSSPICDKEMLADFFSYQGFAHCIDTIIGIPGESAENVYDELSFITAYNPVHLSVYCLSIEAHTKLGKRFHPSADFSSTQRECLESAIVFLKAKGYHHYEISNFSLPGYESRHNTKYWTFQPYIGFGPHSHSFYHGNRYAVAMNVDEYLASSAVSLQLDVREKRDEIVEYLFTGLRMLDGLSLGTMERSIGTSLSDSLWLKLHDLGQRGLLLIKDRGGDTIIQLTTEGLFFSDAVIYELLEDLL